VLDEFSRDASSLKVELGMDYGASEAKDAGQHVEPPPMAHLSGGGVQGDMLASSLESDGPGLSPPVTAADPPGSAQSDLSPTPVRAEISAQQDCQPRYPIPTFYLDTWNVAGQESQSPWLEHKYISPELPVKNNILPSGGLKAWASSNGKPVDPTEIEVIMLYSNRFA